jgi:DNA processing protein
MLGVGTGGPMGDGTPVEPGRDDRQPPGAASHAERDAWAVLTSVAGLGPVALGALLGRYRSASAILREASTPGGVQRLARTRNAERRAGQRHEPVGSDLAGAVADAVQRAPVILGRIRALGLEVVSLDDPRFPPALGEVAFPPHVLFVAGSVEAVRRTPAVAIVGTRHATGYGRTTAARIARTLVAADMVVVSGLALGIDGAAHEATLRAGGRTVAVIGGGHAHLGPPVHRRLADAIVASGGAIVSELAPDLRPTPGTFPRRNRIISGLSVATVVVEAPARSGALITASWAMEQGRGCFLVPGPLDAPASEGCLSLLREFPDLTRIVAGMPQLIADIRLTAGLDRAPAGVAAAAGPVAGGQAIARAALSALGPTERSIADGLLAGHRTVDELVALTDTPVATVLAAIGMLERRGLAVGIHGRYRPAGVLLDA